MSSVTIALAGNPNTGKSTIFNALTGAHQHVGNWPGKTVERKEGVFQHQGLAVKIIDLPGTYSLSAYSPEEEIARDFIIKEKPTLVVNVVDASNLERNLYLTTQILEIGAPVLIVLNMNDVARSRGLQIDVEKLSEALAGIPVLSLVASRGQGLEGLKQQIIDLISERGLTMAVNGSVKNCPENGRRSLGCCS